MSKLNSNSKKKSTNKLVLKRGMFRLTFNYNLKGVDKTNSNSNGKGAVRANLYTTNPKSNGKGWVGRMFENTKAEELQFFANILPFEADALPILEEVVETEVAYINGTPLLPTDPLYDTLLPHAQIVKTGQFQVVEDVYAEAFFKAALGDTSVIAKPGISLNFYDQDVIDEIQNRYESRNELDGNGKSVSNGSIQIVISLYNQKEPNFNYKSSSRMVSAIVHDVQFGPHIGTGGLSLEEVADLMDYIKETVEAPAPAVKEKGYKKLLANTAEAEYQAYINNPPTNIGKKTWKVANETHMRMLRQYPGDMDVIKAAFSALTYIVENTVYKVEYLKDNLAAIDPELVVAYNEYINSLVEEAPVVQHSDETAINVEVTAEQLTATPDIVDASNIDDVEIL